METTTDVTGNSTINRIINVHNSTKSAIEVYVKGFGAYTTNSTLMPCDFNSGIFRIPSKESSTIPIRTVSEIGSKNSTVYRIYAHALMVKFLDDNNSEVHFPTPLDVCSENFIVTSYMIDKKLRLIIQNEDK